MGKFAGFLKRVKRVAGFASNVLIDKINPMTNKWIETSDRTKINKFTDKAKRLGGDVMFKLTNEYTKAQQERMNDFDEKNLIFGNPIN